MTTPDFATRLAQAIALHPRAPSGSYGRLTWLRNELASRTDVDVTVETVRKWTQGETSPRPPKMAALAQVLSVDAGWLAAGAESCSGATARAKTREVPAGVHLIAGLLELGGARIAFPEPDDRAYEEHVDLYAIKDGRHLRVSVSVAQANKTGDAKFELAFPKPEHTLLGIVANPESLMPSVIDLRDVEFSRADARHVAEVPAADIARLTPRSVGDLL